MNTKVETQHLLNNQIKSHKIMLLDKEGQKIGDMSYRDAMQKAYDAKLDLMQVGENGDIAICKLLNYESWLYHENKKRHKQEFKNRSQELKTINFRPVTGENDFKLKSCISFDTALFQIFRFLYFIITFHIILFLDLELQWNIQGYPSLSRDHSRPLLLRLLHLHRL